MLSPDQNIIENVRAKFAHVDTCPFQGERIFFENAGGALTLKSVVDTSAKFAAIPDNQGRDNPASYALVDIIKKAKEDASIFFNANSGQFFVGESGTELIFRIVCAAIMSSEAGGQVLGSTLEHPATRSACEKWAKAADKPHVLIKHNNKTGSVDANAYAEHVTKDTRVATILHTSPVSGMGVDVAAISKAIRNVAPDCFIIVDGIQHAAHGGLDINSYDIDAYVVSPYKMFSRHGYGFAWISDRLSELEHNSLVRGPEKNWELGTRDTGAYATFSDVVEYYEWLGSQFTDASDRREKIMAASYAIKSHETDLTNAMIKGTGNQKGLADMPEVTVLCGIDNPLREGLVAMNIDGMDALELVEALNKRGIRTHARKADHYSGNILTPLGLSSCVRVSMCHYNTEHEVSTFLAAVSEIIESLKN
ncbi:MAG: aminotransferase class V-fold PLP-dependent enzyme [Lentilitoribacter sp.]